MIYLYEKSSNLGKNSYELQDNLTLDFIYSDDFLLSNLK